MGAGQEGTGRDRRRHRAPARRIYLHIGEPKTGTTFIQDSLWANRARLAAQGVHLPGFNARDHSRASRDLRETPHRRDDPADPWRGDWDVLIGQALRVPGRAVISNELLAAATAEQAARAMRSLEAAEAHIILTLRDFGSLLPAEWQEAVKCRDTATWDQWFGKVLATETAPDRRQLSWFWRAHDTLANLDLWSQLIPPERVHVIVVPRPRAPERLWAQFAGVVGFDPAGCDLMSARINSSLGIAETDFLRRMNEHLPADMPDWFYIREVKQILAHGVLAERPESSRLSLAPAQQALALRNAEQIVAGLRASHADIIGDLADLLPVSSAASTDGARIDISQFDRAATVGLLAGSPAEDQLGAAVVAAAALSVRCFSGIYPPRTRERKQRTPREFAAYLRWSALNGITVRRMLRRGSGHPLVRHIRVVIWTLLIHPGRPVVIPVSSGQGKASSAADSLPRIRIPAVPPPASPLADLYADSDASLASPEGAWSARELD